MKKTGNEPQLSGMPAGAGRRAGMRTTALIAIILLLLLSACSTGQGAAAGGERNTDTTVHTDGQAETGTAVEHVSGGLTESTEGEEKQEESAMLKKEYIELLGEYLKEQLELPYYDDAVRELGCIEVEEEDRSEAQKRAGFGLKYLYIRNEAHIDRLSEEDLALLKEGLGKTEGDERDKAMEVVVRTFPACMSPMPITSETFKKQKYVYDNTLAAQDGSTAVTMDTLLIRIATQSEYDEEGEYVDEYNEAQKEKGLYELAERMESEMEGLLGDIPIRVQVDFIL